MIRVHLHFLMLQCIANLTNDFLLSSKICLPWLSYELFVFISLTHASPMQFWHKVQTDPKRTADFHLEKLRL